MKVLELINILEQYDDNEEIIIEFENEYTEVDESDITRVFQQGAVIISNL